MVLMSLGDFGELMICFGLKLKDKDVAEALVI